MKKNLILTLLAVAFIDVLLFARTVDRSTIQAVATHFFRMVNQDVTKEISPIISTYYAYNIPILNIASFGEGFVVLSTEEELPPILAYSGKGSFDANKLPPALSEILDNYARHLKNGITLTRDAFIRNRNSWKDLVSGKNPYISESGNNYQEPLLHSGWNQNYPYNLHCPADPEGPGGHAYAGCVATAMGQVMYYYRYPDQGVGNNSYHSNSYGTISADFGNTTYHWNEMPHYVHHYTNPAVATLLFHCGVSVNTTYTALGSGAYTQDCLEALRDHFKYSEGMNYIFRADTTINYYDSIRSNLDQRMPILYRGGSFWSSHSFVCDGYEGDAFFHFNFGWSGEGNGFYNLDELTPFGYDLVPQQAALINIFPAENYPCYCQDTDTLTTLQGSFTDGSGIYPYQSNTACRWLIQPENSAAHNILLMFKDIDTEEGQDIIRVYDGPDESYPLILEYSGDTNALELMSVNGSILVTFLSNASIQRQGWQASYICMENSFCQPETFYSGINSYISDRSGPYPYMNSSSCLYYLQPEAPWIDSVAGFQFTFYEFSTETGKDFLHIYDGMDMQHGPVISLSGHVMPDIQTIQAKKATLQFITDESTIDKGWALIYDVIFPEYCTDTAIITEASGSIEDGSGSKKYTNNSDCYWLITPPDASSIELTFQDFQIENGYDRLRIYNAFSNPPQILGDYTGQEIPGPVNCPSGKMLLHFISDESVNGEGWKAEYSIGNLGITSPEKNPYKIYPVPARDHIFIENPGSPKIINVSVYSMAGQKVILETIINPDRIKINTTQLPQGLYFLEIIGGNEKHFFRFIKSP